MSNEAPPAPPDQLRVADRPLTALDTAPGRTVPRSSSSTEARRSSLAPLPRATPIVITHESRIEGAAAEALWQAYAENFAPLAELAALQHFYTRDEVLEELANPRITKIVAWVHGEPVGLGMVTNHLESVPQISPDFLRRRYPHHAARDSIYFGILVMVAPAHRGRTMFARIYTELWQVPALAGGVLVFDICDFNREMFDTDSLTRRIAAQFPNSSIGVIDRQTWYAAELPEPIIGVPQPAAVRH